MTNPDNVGGLLPCPFCGCAMQISSSRDWHRVVGDHDGDCLMFDADGTIYPATDEGKAEALATWNRRELCRAAPAGGCDCGSAATSDPDQTRHSADCATYGAPAGGVSCTFAHGDDWPCSTCGTPRKDSAPAGSGEVGSSYMTEVAKQNGFPIYEIDFGDEGKERYIRERDMAALLRKLQQGADYVMVPRELTHAMREAFQHAVANPTGAVPTMRELWSALIAASQDQEGGSHE